MGVASTFCLVAEQRNPPISLETIFVRSIDSSSAQGTFDDCQQCRDPGHQDKGTS